VGLAQLTAGAERVSSTIREARRARELVQYVQTRVCTSSWSADVAWLSAQ